MNTTANSELEQEPMGIVISRGSRLEQAPSVFAYVWAPAPSQEIVEDVLEAKVA